MKPKGFSIISDQRLSSQQLLAFPARVDDGHSVVNDRNTKRFGHFPLKTLYCIRYQKQERYQSCKFRRVIT